MPRPPHSSAHRIPGMPIRHRWTQGDDNLYVTVKLNAPPESSPEDRKRLLRVLMRSAVSAAQKLGCPLEEVDSLLKEEIIALDATLHTRGIVEILDPTLPPFGILERKHGAMATVLLPRSDDPTRALMLKKLPFEVLKPKFQFGDGEEALIKVYLVYGQRPLSLQMVLRLTDQQVTWLLTSGFLAAYAFTEIRPMLQTLTRWNRLSALKSIRAALSPERVKELNLADDDPLRAFLLDPGMDFPSVAPAVKRSTPPAQPTESLTLSELKKGEGTFDQIITLVTSSYQRTEVARRVADELDRQMARKEFRVRFMPTECHFFTMCVRSLRNKTKPERQQHLEHTLQTKL
jgi:hypothetical protein